MDSRRRSGAIHHPLNREGPSGIWVVTGWEMIEPFEQIAPPSDAEITEFLDAFLQAWIDGEGAEEFADFAEYDPFAAERVDREIALLYATTTGAPTSDRSSSS